MQDSVQILMSPIIQCGFAGLSVILLVFLAWLVKRLIALLEKTTVIIKDNTDIISSLKEESGEVKEIVVGLKDRLLARPCIAKGER